MWMKHVLGKEQPPGIRAVSSAQGRREPAIGLLLYSSSWAHTETPPKAQPQGQQQLCLHGLMQDLVGRVTSSPSSLKLFHEVVLGEQSSTELEMRRGTRTERKDWGE